MSYQGTVAPNDPRRHLYVDLRSIQALIGMLRAEPLAWNMPIEAAFEELGSHYCNDLVTAMPAALRQVLTDVEAEDLAQRLAERIPYLTQCLENFTAPRDSPGSAT